MTTTFEAVYANGVFRPVERLELRENSKVRLHYELIHMRSGDNGEAAAVALQQQLKDKYGNLPDSTPVIAESRRRDG